MTPSSRPEPGAITFRKRTSDPSLTYQIEVSYDLRDWFDGSGLTSQASLPLDNGDGTQTMTVRLDAPVDSHGAAFLRLRVAITQ